MPKNIPIGDATTLELLLAALTHGQLSGEITKRMSAVKDGNLKVKELSDTIHDLTAKLQSWWETVPKYARECKYHLPDATISLPSNARLQHVIYQHYSYYGSLIAIHTAFVRPWNNVPLPSDPQERADFSDLMRTSAAIRIEATRDFIQKLPQLEISVASPKW